MGQAEMERTIQVGEPVPDFTLTAHDGREISLADYKGKQALVLYFYPKANTSGCTRESIAFTQQYPQFTKLGAEVFGVSADSPKANSSFCEKHSLKVGGLLTDKDWQLLKQLGLPIHRDKPIKRRTFVIDRDGILRLAYHYTSRGDVTDHVTEALRVVKQIADS